MLVYQGRTSTSSTCSQSIQQLFHLYLPMATHSLCWWAGNLPSLTLCAHPASSVVFRAPVQFCVSTMASTLSPTKEVLPFLFWFLWLVGPDDHHWNRAEVTGMSAMVKYPQRVSEKRIRAQNFLCILPVTDRFPAAVITCPEEKM